MKKTLAMLLAVVMVIGLFAGCGGSGDTETTAATTGETTGIAASGEDTYTYNGSMSVFPTVWSFHTYETSTSATILNLISDGLYTFDFNETMDGYTYVCAMAAEEPIDVTADYVGQYGIEEGDTALVWKFVLRDDLAWEDGTPITANDYVESAMRLLDPVAKNYRADSMYSGDVVIYNAEAYLKQGRSHYVANSGLVFEDLVQNEDGTYSTADGNPVYFALTTALDWLGGYTLTYYVEGYGDAYFDTSCWEDLVALSDSEGMVALTDETYAMMSTTTTGNPAWGETDDDLGNYMVYADYIYPEIDFSEVGVIALSDYELVYVLTTPSEGFYLKYGLPDGYLVYTELYDACASYVDGVYSNSYGTSLDTTMSYGPYKLTAFQADKEFVFEKNENYYDLTDDTYQTTSIVYEYVPEVSTRLEMFLSGELDTLGLDKDLLETYSTSDYCYYETSASVWAMVFNPDLAALTETQANAGDNINKTILTVTEFRQAMAYGMDRTAFSLATVPTCVPTYGILSSQHIVDPETGEGYRTTEIAKQVLVEFWGLSEDVGEGKLYPTIDDAVAAITGYNPTLAQQKFNEAYDIAIEQGLMDEDDVIQICIGLPSATSTTYNNGYEYIVNQYTELVKGTKLEGKLTFTKDDTIGDNFAGSLKNNQVDMLFYVGWSGMELNPYGLIQAYVETDYQYDPSTDYSTQELTITIDGEEMTTNVKNWYYIMNGVTAAIEPVTLADGTTKTVSYGSADGNAEARLQILGAVEGAIMMNYCFIPLSGDSSAFLKGAKIEYPVEEYVFGMGFGGLKYMTYNYTDAEWDAYVASQGGTLNYA